MNTLIAFAMGEANRGKEKMVFDWNTAEMLIREKRPEIARAGLCGDWEYTGGTIYKGGKPVKDTYTYLASTWAVPELNMDREIVECYRMQHEVPQWDENTKWPYSALTILSEADEGGGTAMMTREEAIELLKYRRNIISNVDVDWNANEIEAINFALSALLPVSREQVEKVWRGEWESTGAISCKCSKCNRLELKSRANEYNFCPYCMAPVTDEAVEMVMERMEEMKNG